MKPELSIIESRMILNLYRGSEIKEVLKHVSEKIKQELVDKYWASNQELEVIFKDLEEFINDIQE